MHKLQKNKSSKRKLTDCITLMIRATLILNYVKKVSDSKYKKNILYINCSLIMLTFWNLNAPILIYRVMQSVLYNYIILLNRKKRRTIIRFNFLKLISPLFWQVPHVGFPIKKRKTPTPSKKILRTKMASPLDSSGERKL